MTPPRYDNRFNLTTVVAAANLALLLVGGGMAYQKLSGALENNSRDIAGLQVDASARDARIHSLELGAGRTDEKLTNILSILARIERQLEGVRAAP
jgi:hypothetical protein